MREQVIIQDGELFYIVNDSLELHEEVALLRMYRAIGGKLLPEAVSRVLDIYELL